MGMDVVGRPSSTDGKRFQTIIWSWRPIHDLILRLCFDLLDDGALVGIAFNDGAGPQDQTTGSETPNRFKRWMEHHVSGHGVESDLRVTKNGALVSEQESQENPSLKTERF
jgi:hypothetical protein